MILLDVMTFWNVDLAVRNEAATLRTEAVMLLSVTPQVDDDRNAAVLYEKAFARLKQDTSFTSPGSPMEQDNPDPASPAVAQLLDRHANTLRLLREASAMPACRFEHDFVHPRISMLLPELGNVAPLPSCWPSRPNTTSSPAKCLKPLTTSTRLSARPGRGERSVHRFQPGADRHRCRGREDVAGRRPAPEPGGRTARVADRRRRRSPSRGAAKPDWRGGVRALGLQRPGIGSVDGDGPCWHRPAPWAEPRRGVLLPPIPILLRIFVMPSDTRGRYQQHPRRRRQQVLEPFTPTTIEEAGTGGMKAARNGVLDVADRAGPQPIHAASRDRRGALRGADGIAVDRYRLDHGAFPATLDVLVPQYLDDMRPMTPSTAIPCASSSAMTRRCFTALALT